MLFQLLIEICVVPSYLLYNYYYYYTYKSNLNSKNFSLFLLLKFFFISDILNSQCETQRQYDSFQTQQTVPLGIVQK
jgi:hypothetical protein